MLKVAANFSLAKSVGTAENSALKLANWPNWKEIRRKFNVLSESLGNCNGNDNNKERFTEQHNNSAHATNSSF